MLKEKIKQNGYTIKEIADKLKIDENDFIKKLNMNIEFKVREVIMLTSLLHLTYREVEQIFLNNNSHFARK